MSATQWQTPVLTDITDEWAEIAAEQARDIASRMAVIKRGYDTSSGLDRDRELASALIMCGPFRPLPDWLYEALLDEKMDRLRGHDNWLFTGERPKLRQQKPDRAALRRATVTEARRDGFKGNAAYVEAAKRLKDTLAGGSSWAMRSAMRRKGQKRPT